MTTDCADVSPVCQLMCAFDVRVLDIGERTSVNSQIAAMTEGSTGRFTCDDSGSLHRTRPPCQAEKCQ